MAKVLRFASVAEQPTRPVVEVNLIEEPPKRLEQIKDSSRFGMESEHSLNSAEKEEKKREEKNDDGERMMVESQENDPDMNERMVSPNRTNTSSKSTSIPTPSQGTGRRLRRSRRRRREASTEKTEETEKKERDDYIKSLVTQNEELRGKVSLYLFVLSSHTYRNLRVI